MRKLLIIAALLYGHCSAQQWIDMDVSPQQAKLAEYMRQGWSPDSVIVGLRNWFGLNFEAYQFRPGFLDIYLVLRRADGTIYYLKKIGDIASKI